MRQPWLSNSLFNLTSSIENNNLDGFLFEVLKENKKLFFR